MLKHFLVIWLLLVVSIVIIIIILQNKGVICLHPS